MDKITFTEKDGILTAKLNGELDHCLAASVRERIDSEFYKRRPDMLILDISSITFMDSSGLGLIMGRYTACKRLGAKFKLYGADRRAKKILSLAGLCSVITLEDNNERSAAK